ncbi:MAG: prolipoprotein diacylglyceryl transferase [Marmoricola sp.]
MEFPNIDPSIHIGPLSLHWYGLMYVIGVGVAWWLGRRRARVEGSGWTVSEIDDLAFWVAAGVVAGGRIGYTFIYGWEQIRADPLYILKVWEGGMSFHGGLIGVLVAMWLYARKTNRPFFYVVDWIAPLVPPGLFTGRIGNFINGELWGKTTDLPWGIIFPTGGPDPRHPTMLYEALLEGIVLFTILWIYSASPHRRVGQVSGVFALVYGLIRVAIEFVRVPDAHIGYLAGGWVTMGMVLSLPMIALGIYLLVRKAPLTSEVSSGVASQA